VLVYRSDRSPVESHRLQQNANHLRTIKRPSLSGSAKTPFFFPFRSIVSRHEYDALGEDFEKKEDELFGDEGFFKVVDHVSELEKKLGIYELSQFAPK
jgi:hypothetical protein